MRQGTLWGSKSYNNGFPKCLPSVYPLGPKEALWFSLQGKSSLINQQVDGASKFNNCEVQINHSCQCWLRLYSFKSVKFKQQSSSPASRHTRLTAPTHGLECLPRVRLHSRPSVGKWGRRKEVELQPERWPILVTERSWKFKVNNSLSCPLCVRFHPRSCWWKGNQALASYSSCTTGPSNPLFVADLLTSNMRAWTMVQDCSWTFCRFEWSQDWRVFPSPPPDSSP